MVTYKSLIVSFALILALIGAGIFAASAHTLAPAQQQHTILSYQDGIAAISVATGKHKHVSIQDVKHYLKSKGFVGGTTLTGQAPTLKSLQLTSIIHLDSLLYSLLAQLPGNKSVYYAQLEGPFIVLPQLPLPVLTTLIPSATNLPAFIPHLSNLSSLGLTSPLFGLLPVPNLTIPHKIPAVPGPHHTSSSSSGIFRMPDLSNLQSSFVPKSQPGKLQIMHNNGVTDVHPSNAQSDSASKSTTTLSEKDVDTILADVYEVFDADNGNLLAWG